MAGSAVVPACSVPASAAGSPAVMGASPAAGVSGSAPARSGPGASSGAVSGASAGVSEPAASWSPGGGWSGACGAVVEPSVVVGSDVMPPGTPLPPAAAIEGGPASGLLHRLAVLFGVDDEPHVVHYEEAVRRGGSLVKVEVDGEARATAARDALLALPDYVLSRDR